MRDVMSASRERNLSTSNGLRPPSCVVPRSHHAAPVGAHVSRGTQGQRPAEHAAGARARSVIDASVFHMCIVSCAPCRQMARASVVRVGEGGGGSREYVESGFEGGYGGAHMSQARHVLVCLTPQAAEAPAGRFLLVIGDVGLAAATPLEVPALLPPVAPPSRPRPLPPPPVLLPPAALPARRAEPRRSRLRDCCWPRAAARPWRVALLVSGVGTGFAGTGDAVAERIAYRSGVPHCVSVMHRRWLATAGIGEPSASRSTPPRHGTPHVCRMSSLTARAAAWGGCTAGVNPTRPPFSGVSFSH